MAETQPAPSPNAAQHSQQFIELIMMNAQQAALCLGQMAHPSTGKAEVNLEAARMFIDHLEIIREKTRGNLNKDEEKILTSVLSELRMAFVQVASGGGGHVHDEHETPPVSVTEAAPETTQEATPKAPSTTSEEDEGKKKFTKSYGA